MLCGTLSCSLGRDEVLRVVSAVACTPCQLGLGRQVPDIESEGRRSSSRECCSQHVHRRGRVNLGHTHETGFGLTRSTSLGTAPDLLKFD